jgi:Amt family ammonium transporter
MAQLAGVVGVGIFVFVVSLIFWKIIKATIGIRVSAEEEIEGLDIGEHGNIAYPDFVTVTARGAMIAGGLPGASAEASATVHARELSKGTA